MYNGWTKPGNDTKHGEGWRNSLRYKHLDNCECEHCVEEETDCEEEEDDSVEN